MFCEESICEEWVLFLRWKMQNERKTVQNERKLTKNERKPRKVNENTLKVNGTWIQAINPQKSFEKILTYDTESVKLH